MDATEAKQLRLHDRVIWDNDPNDCGEVIEAGNWAVRIHWDNGQTGHIHVNDCARVSRSQTAAQGN